MSLTLRLTLLFGCVVGLVLSGLGFLVFRETSAHFVELDQALLRDKVHMVRETGRISIDPDDLGKRLESSLNGHGGLYLRVFSGERQIFSLGDLAVPQQMQDDRPQAGPEPGLAWAVDGVSYYGEMSEMPAPGQETGVLKVFSAVDTHHHQHFLTQLQRKLLIYIVASMAIGTLLGWVASRRGLAPLTAMRRRAERVSSRELGERMQADSVPVEMRNLANSLNGMLERLQRDFDRLNAFANDLAHEMRTPVSNLLTGAQVTLAQPRSSDEYRSSLETMSEELQRMGKIISDMLYLAKTENTAALPSREAVALHDEVQSLVDFYEAVAAEKSITLSLTGAAHVNGNRLMIRRAIGNLLSNAVRHSSTGKPVLIRIEGAPAGFALSVDNQGDPIASDHQESIFDRFVRISDGRQRLESDGVGLGLPITKAIMAAHLGHVQVKSEGGLTTFTLTFPR